MVIDDVSPGETEDIRELPVATSIEQPNVATSVPSTTIGPTVETLQPPNQIVVRSDDDDDLLEDESDNESDDWRAALVRLFRFKPGLWLSVNLPYELLSDITNYPYAVREDIMHCVFEAMVKSENAATYLSYPAAPIAAADKTENEPPLPSNGGDSALKGNLAHILRLEDEADSTINETADRVLPRFLWYRLELEKLYGADFVKESMVDERSGFKPKLSELDLIEGSNKAGGSDLITNASTIDLVDSAPGSQDIGATASADLQETPVIESITVVEDDQIDSMGPETLEAQQQSPILFCKKKKRKIQLSYQALPTSDGQQVVAPSNIAGSNNITPTTITDRTDPFSMALKDIQFRLSRHGTVGDPRDYFGKGEGMMDKDDPFIDDEEMMAEIGLSKEDLEADDRSEDENDSGGSELSEGGEEEGGEYENTEDQFMIDNDSEPEEITEAVDDLEEGATDLNKKGAVSKKRSKERDPTRDEFRHVDFVKPSSLPLVYNPKAWRQAKSKMEIPPLIILFFFNLECLLSAKRLPILQRQIFDTIEFCQIDEAHSSVKLNDAGEALCKDFITKILQGAYSTFLVPFAPMTDLPGCSDVQMPRHSKIFLARHGEGTEVKTSFVRDFVDSHSGMADVVYEIVKTYVTPFGPSLEETKKFWWTALTIHTQRVFARKEDTFIEELTKFFKQNTGADWKMITAKIAEYTARLRLAKRAQGDKPPKTQEEITAEADEEAAFKVFDEIAPAIVDFAISFNQKRNIMRDVLDAGQLPLVKLCCTGELDEETGSTEMAKLERNLNLTWVTRCLNCIEDTSAQVLGFPVKSSPIWLEHRFRKFRTMLRISMIHDRRKQRTLKVIKEERPKKEPPIPTKKEPISLPKKTPAIGSSKSTNSPPSQQAQKRKRDTGTHQSVSVSHTASSDATQAPALAPAIKKKRLNSPPSVPPQAAGFTDMKRSPGPATSPKSMKSLVGGLFKYYDISRVFFLLQASPFLLPLNIVISLPCPTSEPLNDAEVEVLTVNNNIIQGTLNNVNSWDSQDLTLVVDGAPIPFKSLKEAVHYLEEKYKVSCVTESAVSLEDTDCRAWQTATMGLEACEGPSPTQSPSSSNLSTSAVPSIPQRVSLLDFLSMHLWLNSYSGRDIDSLLLNLVFTDGEIGGPAKWITPPRRLVRAITESKYDHIPMKSNGQYGELERYRSGQLSFLSTFLKLTSSMITSGLNMPIRSSNFGGA